MSETVRIGNVKAERGTMKRGFLKVGETVVDEVKMPIVIINGSKPGPKLCLTAGIHGSEYCGIEAIIRVTRQIDPTELNGVVLAVPIVNMHAFETRGPQGGMSTPFHCPHDSINLNRIFPGNPDGTMSYQIAYTLIKEVISKADYYIDLHGGDLNEELLNHVEIYNGKDEKTNKATMDVLVASFNTKYLSISTREGTACYAATELGIPSLISEVGGYGRLTEDAVQFHLDGIMNIMKRLKMIDGTPTKTPEKKVTPTYTLIARRGGIFKAPPLGSIVKKGEKVGEIRNIFGDTLDIIISPIDGVVRYRRGPYPVSTGDRLVGITAFEESVPRPPQYPYP